MQCTNTHVFNRHFGLGDAIGLPHTHDLVGWQRAGTHTTLVSASVHLCLNPHARFAPYEQRADAFRAVSFVRSEAHQIDWQGRHINIDTAGCLSGVDVKDDAL